MLIDFVVLCLLFTAVLAGFQQGLFRSFTLLLSCFFAMIACLVMTPALIRFLEHSFGQFEIAYQFVATILFFLLITLILYQLLQELNRGERATYIRMSLGSLMLCGMMLFSIGVISGFLERSGLIKAEVIADTHCSLVIQPIQNLTSSICEKAMIGADTIKERTQEKRREALSRIN
ncbi:MAG: hypothetical protein KTR24_02020 [Saprospiraceae bacterium]|nr:hypothetical protein [Saprospiraceae bacterium]